MASGCTASSSPSLTGCANPIVDSCVRYTGPAIPSLGICTGDTLTELESVILTNIQNFATGIGIMISGIDYGTCSLFTQYVTCCNASGDVPKSLKELLKIIFDTLCALDARLTTVETFITDLQTGPYVTACLTLPANPTFKQIVQAMAIKICQLDTALTNLTNTVNNLITNLPGTIGDFLLAHINSCETGSLVKTGSGATANIQILGLAPVGSIMAYDGDMSLFDATGLGRTGTSACNWALCNDLNGTRNMNGVTVMGVTTMGGSTNPAADGGTYSLGTTGGKIMVALSVSNIPTMGISGTTSGASGSIGFYTVSRKHASTGDNTMSYQCDGGGTSTPCPSAPNRTIPITIPSQTVTGSVGGGGSAHENRMPYVALPWIKRIS